MFQVKVSSSGETKVDSHFSEPTLPFFLGVEGLGVADLAPSLQGEFISGWEIF